MTCFFVTEAFSGQVSTKVLLIEAHVYFLLYIYFIFQLDLKYVILFEKTNLKVKVRITLKGQRRILILHVVVKNIPINWFLCHLCCHLRYLSCVTLGKLSCVMQD